MASISYSFNATNASGNYTIQVRDCADTSTIYTALRTGAATTGTITGTLTDVSLNTDLGSVKLKIFDTDNNVIINTSSCFNHNCSSCVALTDFTLTTSNNIDYGDTIVCTITGVTGSSPYVYVFRLKQNGITIASNTDTSINAFGFTNNVCPHLGTITVEASVTNCGATITKTNTVVVSAPSPPAPVLTVCYSGSAQWLFSAAAGMFPESLVGLFEFPSGNFISYFDGTSTLLRTVTTDNVTFGTRYVAKLTTCNVTSGESNPVTTSFTAC